MDITKRSGTRVPYDREKILKAINKGFKAVGLIYDNDFWNSQVSMLEDEFKEGITVEEIQNKVISKIMDNGYHSVAINYIAYRERRAIARTMDINASTVISEYLGGNDMAVKENSSTSFSLQGLNAYMFGTMSEKYWLELYSPKIREEYNKGRIHLHDLSTISSYCMGWDLKQLLIEGFTGVKGKPTSGPAKHFMSALNQSVNFIFTLQGEAAGAMAFSNFNTLLAPFIRYDNLNYNQVKQSIQQYIYDMNISTRVGFQCLSEDTEILTESGWKSRGEIKKGDKIKNFNLDSQEIELQEVEDVFDRPYEGVMYHLKNKITDQLISPKHRIVRRLSNGKLVLEEIEETKKLTNNFRVPAATNGYNPDNKETIDIDMVKLSAWVISEGTIDKNSRGTGRITIYQSKRSKHYKYIKSLLDSTNMIYSEYSSVSPWGKCSRFRMNAESSRRILEFMETDKCNGVKKIPDKILKLDVNIARIFIEEYLKGDGDLSRYRTSTVHEQLLDDLSELAVIAGYQTSTWIKTPSINNKKTVYAINFIRTKDIYIDNVREVKYKGNIWCPTTKNGTVIARRNGKTFITGNSPFSNITLDLDVTKTPLADEQVIIGGKMMPETYKEFQNEANMINKAILEVMMEGDGNGAIHAYPILTFNVTENFPWDEEVGDLVLKLAAKYGAPYFANFINSESTESDIRSMCPLVGDTKVLIKNSRDTILSHPIDKIYRDSKKRKGKLEVLYKGKWYPARVNKIAKTKTYQFTMSNGTIIEMGENHLQPTRNNGTLKAKELKEGMWLPFNKDTYSTSLGSYDMGYIIGAYLGDGSVSKYGIVYTICADEKSDSVEKKIVDFWNSIGCKVNINVYDDKVRYISVNSFSKDIIDRYVGGSNAITKYLKNSVFSMSNDFRCGVIDGFSNTDGARDKRRLYTSSDLLRHDITYLLSSIGRKYLINYEDSRDGRLGKNINYRIDHPLRKNYSDLYDEDENYNYYSIKSIKDIGNKKDLYCFEVDNDDHLFTLSNGLVTHNCRLKINNNDIKNFIESEYSGGLNKEDYDKEHVKGGGFFGASPKTGSIGVVTLGLPSIMHDHIKTGDRSWSGYKNRIKGYMDIAIEALQKKRKEVEMLADKGLYPYTTYYMRDVKERTGKYFSQHFSTICTNGFHEALIVYGIKEGMDSQEGWELAEDLIKSMKEYSIELQKTHRVLINIEQAPAESAGVKLCRKSGVDPLNNGYYTNSTWFPADTKTDLKDQILVQGKINNHYTGGSSFHNYTDVDLLPIYKSLKDYIIQVFTKTSIPYMTISPVYSICSKCGRISGRHITCPTCGGDDIYTQSRVVGYYRIENNFNDGRRKEAKHREGHYTKDFNVNI